MTRYYTIDPKGQREAAAIAFRGLVHSLRFHRTLSRVDFVLSSYHTLKLMGEEDKSRGGQGSSLPLAEVGSADAAGKGSGVRSAQLKQRALDSVYGKYDTAVDVRCKGGRTITNRHQRTEAHHAKQRDAFGAQKGCGEVRATRRLGQHAHDRDGERDVERGGERDVERKKEADWESEGEGELGGEGKLEGGGKVVGEREFLHEHGYDDDDAGQGGGQPAHGADTDADVETATDAAAGAATHATPRSPANVLLIIANGLRPALGVYGRRALTPELDAFAASERTLTFDAAYAQITICNPVRATTST